MSRGLNILIGIDLKTAMLIAQQQMDHVESRGGVDAACLDLERHHGRKLTDDERQIVAQSMTLGMCMGYVILGQNLKAAEDEMRKHGIDPAEVARLARQGLDDSDALKSTENEHEAERETNNLLTRISKRSLH